MTYIARARLDIARDRRACNALAAEFLQDAAKERTDATTLLPAALRARALRRARKLVELAAETRGDARALGANLP